MTSKIHIVKKANAKQIRDTLKITKSDIAIVKQTISRVRNDY